MRSRRASRERMHSSGESGGRGQNVSSGAPAGSKQAGGNPADAAKGKKPGFIGIAGSKINSLYQRLPLVPFLDRATSAILYASVAAYLIFTASVFFSFSGMAPSYRMSEYPLHKNALLQLQPGESYAYLLAMPQGNSEVYYQISSSPSCAGVEIGEKAESGQSSRCVLPGGNLADKGFENINSGMGNLSVILFSPWMLAVSDNFSWQVNTTISGVGVQMDMPLYMNSMGKKAVAGRQAYEISVQSEGQPQATFYVDAQKRVALLVVAGNTSAQLVSAPFALDWGNSSQQN